MRTRGYDCRQESLELLVKQQTVKPVDVDAWTRANVDAVCDYFEKHGFYGTLRPSVSFELSDISHGFRG